MLAENRPNGSPEGYSGGGTAQATTCTPGVLPRARPRPYIKGNFKSAAKRHVAQQFSFWWTGVRPKGHTGLEKDWAAILGRLGLIQGRDGGARQPAERRAALL